MTDVWKIADGGETGVIFDQAIDAPGSITLITWADLATGPAEGPEVPVTAECDDLGPLPIFVVAGTYHQYLRYIKSGRLTRSQQRRARYVSYEHVLTGISRGRFILTGTYDDRSDWPDIHRTIDMLATFFDAEVTVDPY